jgi:nitroreductase
MVTMKSEEVEVRGGSAHRRAADSGAVILAIQNLMLAARALGVGGTMTTPHHVVEGRVHEPFGIPRGGVRAIDCVLLG